MRALTICQPYAHLICLPDDDDRAKRVENRTWSTDYRGPLLIHAGKSRKFLRGDNYGIPIESMDFGAIVGVCELADCVSTQQASVSTRWPWLKFHDHAEGPCCFVLTNVRRFEKPIPYKGAQGFFNVPNELVSEAVQ